MHIDFQIALDYARRLSRPRQVGTPQEREVADEISKQLQQSGCSVETQDFQFSTAFERFLVLEIFAGLVLVLAAILTLGLYQWLTLLLAGLLAFLILLIAPINRLVQKHSIRFAEHQSVSFWSGIIWQLGKRYSTTNIAASWPQFPHERNLPQLYLVAHYDSKSQYLPLVVRIALFVLVIAGSLVFSILNLINAFLLPCTPALYSIGIIVIVCATPLLFLDYGNDSTGAIDNASGVGLVLHLAEIIAQKPVLMGKLGITVLITSAEELAVKGSWAYLLENKNRLRRQAEGEGLHILNFDGIGVDGKLYLAGGSRQRADSSDAYLHYLVRHSAQEIGIPVGRFLFPGAMFDHIPFAEEGFDAVTVIGIGKDSLSVHTGKDLPEKLHVKGFDQAGRLALRLIEKLSGERIIRSN